MNQAKRYDLWINITVEANSEDAAFDYAFEAMCLTEGQGLMDHRPEMLMTWSIEGPSETETMWTSCNNCGYLNIEIIEDTAPEVCNACD